MNKRTIKSSPVAGKRRNGAVSYYGEIDFETMAVRELLGQLGKFLVIVGIGVVLVLAARLILGDI